MPIKEKKFQYYEVYGLRLKSEISMRQLISLSKDEEESVDVVIEYGKMPEGVYHTLESGRNYSFTNDTMWIQIEEVAIYYITQGNYILVEPLGDADNETLKNFLLGLISCMLFIQRKEIALHGASVIKNGENAITILGESGAGKSTLTNTLLQRGYKLIADDLSVIGFDEQEIKVNSGYPQQKLSGEMIYHFGDVAEAYNLIDKKRNKYAIPIREQFIEQAQVLRTIYELQIGEGEEVQYKEVLGYEKILILMKYIGAGEVLHYVGRREEYFRMCVQLAKHIQVIRLIRPCGKMTVNEQAEIVESFY